MTRVWIGIGSNLGDRQGNLRFGLTQLEKAGFYLEAVSSLFDTVPQGPISQPRFINQAVRGRWHGTANELLSVLKRIEECAGREDGPRWGPRVLDLDILLLGREGEELLMSPDLEIPHPRLRERAFVLVPLCELDPKLTVPVTGRTVEELLQSLGGWSHLVEPCRTQNGEQENKGIRYDARTNCFETGDGGA